MKINYQANINHFYSRSDYCQIVGSPAKDVRDIHFTADGAYWYKQMSRVLLTAVEYALYGEAGIEEAERGNMEAMKNLR